MITICRSALLIACLGAISGGAASGQTIRGRLLEDGTDKPLAAGMVALLDEQGRTLSATLTDSAGHFMLQTENPGRFKLFTKVLGYPEVTTAAVLLETGTVLTVHVYLHPSVVLLAPLEITAKSRPLIAGGMMQSFDERRAKGQGFVITRKDIEDRNARSVTDLLRTLPGVRIEGGVVTTAGSHTRYDGFCPVKVFLDGVEFRWGYAAINDIPTYDIEAIEVFQNMAVLPPEFAGQDTRCGVIAVWTRRGNRRGS